MFIYSCDQRRFCGKRVINLGLTLWLVGDGYINYCLPLVQANSHTLRQSTFAHCVWPCWHTAQCRHNRGVLAVSVGRHLSPVVAARCSTVNWTTAAVYSRSHTDDPSSLAPTHHTWWHKTLSSRTCTVEVLFTDRTHLKLTDAIPMLQSKVSFTDQ